MVAAVEKLDRYVALTILASWERPSVYAFVDSATRPSALLQVFAFDDNYSFGILSSSLHRLWFEARCSRLKSDLRYTRSSVFDSFPWPQTPTPQQVARIDKIVDELLEVRAANLAAGMTLARQYDTLRQPGKSRLRDPHAALDRAVIAAYGFNTDEDLLAQLFALNLDLAANPGNARGPGPVTTSATPVASA